MDDRNVVDPISGSTNTTTPTNASDSDPDRPVRVLVQTQTHLVPGDRFTEFGKRDDAMLSLICQHVWKREFDQFRERRWNYNPYYAVDNVECWFLVDHHGPDPIPPSDPPVVWYRWTGSEL